MLTREGFVVADMSAPTPLQRSSWKAEAIRKGNLKISGPIPITEDTPLNEEEEKEFAEKSAQDGALQPQDALEESQRPQTPQRPLQSPTDIHPTALRSNPIEQQPQRDEESYQRQPSRSPPKAQHANEVQRESVVQPTPVMSPTPFRSTPESTSKTQKKRKSGLRNVFRKMFGRKSRDEAENIEEETTPRGHSYHHSVRLRECSRLLLLTLSRTLVCWDSHHPENASHNPKGNGHLLGPEYRIYLSKNFSRCIR
jgi:hypothetical protein